MGQDKLMWHLDCEECGLGSLHDFPYHDGVTCPNCGTVYNTDWDEGDNRDDCSMYAWTTGINKENMVVGKKMEDTDMAGRKMPVTKLEQSTINNILWGLEKRTQLKWQGTGLNPAAGIGYGYKEQMNFLAAHDNGELRIYASTDSSMMEMAPDEFVDECAKRHGNRRR